MIVRIPSAGHPGQGHLHSSPVAQRAAAARGTQAVGGPASATRFDLRADPVRFVAHRKLVAERSSRSPNPPSVERFLHTHPRPTRGEDEAGVPPSKAERPGLPPPRTPSPVDSTDSSAPFAPELPTQKLPSLLLTVLPFESGVGSACVRHFREPRESFSRVPAIPKPVRTTHRVVQLRHDPAEFRDANRRRGSSKASDGRARGDQGLEARKPLLTVRFAAAAPRTEEVMRVPLSDPDRPVELKHRIQEHLGVSVYQQQLIFNGKVLNDNVPLSQQNVLRGDTVWLELHQPLYSAPPVSPVTAR